MRRARFLALFLTGCTFTPGPEPVDDEQDDAAIIDVGEPNDAGPLDAPDTGGVDGGPEVDTGVEPCANWAAPFFDACAVGNPSPPLTLDQPGEYRFDTDTGVLTNPSGSPITIATSSVTQGNGVATILYAESISVSAFSVLRAVGTRSFIVSVHSASIVGRVDVSSRRVGASVDAGAGADVFCAIDGTASGVEANENGAGGSGGAGGSFGSLGGAGGGTIKGETAGGQPAPVVPLAVIQGGCPGGFGVGRISDNAADVGPPGSGGGGLLITARDAIFIDGELAATGAGGGLGPEWAGGGGGGSGGLIALQAPTVEAGPNARVVATGGGGAGAVVHDGQAGTPGGNGHGAAAAVGGNAGPHPHSAAGGTGAFDLAEARAGAIGDDSGGGGGGGAGYNLVLTDTPQLDARAVFVPAIRTGLLQ